MIDPDDAPKGEATEPDEEQRALLVALYDSSTKPLALQRLAARDRERDAKQLADLVLLLARCEAFVLGADIALIRMGEGPALRRDLREAIDRARGKP